MQSQNFLSYCPGIPGVIKTRFGSSGLRRIEFRRLDSLNNVGFYGSYKSYYNTGQLYCQGRIEKMRPAGNWEFYDIAGTLINKINFKDSVFTFADTSQKQNILGRLTGYYGDGRIRCEAYVTALDVSYDCNTHADKSAFELILKDNYDYYGKDNCRNGYGLVKQYSESGLLEAQGRLENYMKTGLWKYYDPNSKLSKMGTYINNLEDGTWLEGDLEGLNYEDAACFDRSNEEDMKKYLENQKKLQMRKSIYKKGELLEERTFYVNMNKE
jgi:antitoxin component YwqK of YwqJK toxin-antitoxin module